jgi:hypothetical protein
MSLLGQHLKCDTFLGNSAFTPKADIHLSPQPHTAGLRRVPFGVRPCNGSGRILLGAVVMFERD